ncbi:succinate dehydrogenase assembly factor 2 [Magnetococcales bacterium HHB-1]
MDVGKKRILFLASRRGMPEVEAIFSRFLDEKLATMDEETLAQFSLLLQCADADILDWLMGVVEVPAHLDRHLLKQISLYR